MIYFVLSTYLMYAFKLLVYPKTDTSLSSTPWLFTPVLKASFFDLIEADKINHFECPIKVCFTFIGLAVRRIENFVRIGLELC